MRAVFRPVVVVILAIFLNTAAVLPAAADDPQVTSLISLEVSDAIAADNALFAANELLNPTPTDSNGRKTISVSFFVGRIGPLHPGQGNWDNTDSSDEDSFSMRLVVPEGGTPANGFSSFAGINFHHVPPIAPVNPPSFDFKPNRSGLSGGSPRLVIRFSDGGNINLRPLTWEANVWKSEGDLNSTAVEDPASATNWDNNGGTCGFMFQQTYATVRACHAAAVVTAAFIVTDSGWLNGPYINWIDAIQYDGQIISEPPDNSR
jgi:hypothetical protein